jgi:hypothetical protein
MKRTFAQLIGVYAASFAALMFITSMLWSGWFKPVENLFETCWVGKSKKGTGDDMPSKLGRIRGSNYFLTPQGRHSGYCLVTSWAISHVMLYAVLGYMFPERFWETFAIGALFEAAEWVVMDCHDVLDIVWNSMGFFLGYCLQKRFRK